MIKKIGLLIFIAVFSSCENKPSNINDLKEASEKEIASAQETAKVETATKSNACLTDQSVIEDLNKRQAIIEEKEKELAKKESEFQARERAITAEIDQLKQVRDEINAVNVAIQKRNEAKLAKLIETVERMSPKAAAKLLSSVDDTLAVETMLKLSTDRLAKIMNIMEPERASQLSEFMTLEKMRKTSKRMPAEANGGEQKNVTAAK